MVDTWKDWTGARHIYMYLPDELGLSRISFYHREAPNSLNMFLYLVLVECHAVNTPERQVYRIFFLFYILLNFSYLIIKFTSLFLSGMFMHENNYYYTNYSL